MNEDKPESPLPAPVPIARPVKNSINLIQLKSFKRERQEKKMMTSRNSPRKPMCFHLEPEECFRAFNSVDIRRTVVKPSVILRAKKIIQEEAATARKIPTRIIDLTKKRPMSITKSNARAN